jgi:endoribonuclease LACTB2
MRREAEFHYQEITLDGNVTISLVQSRAFLRGIGIDGKVIATPGHSDDSVTLVLDAGIAFVGDLPPPQLITDASLQRSWEAIRAHQVHTVYPGHGPVYQLTDEGRG